MIELQGTPSDWIADRGRPAKALMRRERGMPAYESGETGALLVLENLLAFKTGRFRKLGGIAAADRNIMLLPFRYNRAAAVSVAADEDLVALHDDPDAVWSWRPLLYTVDRRGLTRLGSQMELEWRWGLMEAMRYEADLADQIERLAEECVKEKRPFEEFQELVYARVAEHRAQWDQVYEMGKANERAERLLLEHLNPQQRLDYQARGLFYVRGTINRLYQIESGNGAAILHPETRQQQVSLCLHPERWMPNADVSLATKLLIEAGAASEQQMLEGARPRLVPGRTLAGQLERVAWKLERELLPAPFSEVT